MLDAVVQGKKVIGYHPSQRSEVARVDGEWVTDEGGGSFTPEQLEAIRQRQQREAEGRPKL